MRVVGGKTGADGRLFAYLVWTVPGGPAEKGGLQQGDKVFDTSLEMTEKKRRSHTHIHTWPDRTRAHSSHCIGKLR